MIECEVCGDTEPKATPYDPKKIWRYDKNKSHRFCGRNCYKKWWRINNPSDDDVDEVKKPTVVNRTGFPATPKEKRIWMSSGRAEAAVARYKLMCSNIGNLPPTKHEIALLMSGEQVHGFCVPRTGSGVYQLTQQKNRRTK